MVPCPEGQATPRACAALELSSQQAYRRGAGRVQPWSPQDHGVGSPTVGLHPTRSDTSVSHFISAFPLPSEVDGPAESTPPAGPSAPGRSLPVLGSGRERQGIPTPGRISCAAQDLFALRRRALRWVGHEPSLRHLGERRPLCRGRARGNPDVPHLPREQVEPRIEPADPSGHAVVRRSLSSPGVLPQSTAREPPRPPLAMREGAASSPRSRAASSRYEPLSPSCVRQQAAIGLLGLSPPRGLTGPREARLKKSGCSAGPALSTHAGPFPRLFTNANALG